MSKWKVDIVEKISSFSTDVDSYSLPTFMDGT